MKLLPWEYAVRNLARSPLRLALSVLGSALVVLLVLSASAFVRGMESGLGASGSDANVLLLSAGSEESVERSEMDASATGVVQASLSGIKSRLGVAYLSPEVHLAAELKLERDATQVLPALLRGVRPEAFLVHGQVQITAGRAPQPGRDELLVGRLAATRMGVSADRLAIGSTLWFDNRLWTIVGHFEVPGTLMEAEIWCPLSDLQIATRRDSLSCIAMTLDASTTQFEDVDAFCKQRLDLELIAMRESDYYSKLKGFYQPVRTMVWITALLVAMGGLLGGLNTMYAAFASRVRELGALQAIGYPRRAIVLSLVQESVLACSAGALLASLVALLLLDGLAVRVSMGAFGLSVDSTALIVGLVSGVMLGVVGALPPAWRCLGMPIPAALKAV